MSSALACLAVAVVTPLAVGAPVASAEPEGELVGVRSIGADVKRLSFRFGPIVAAPGQNLILVGPSVIERPLGDGYVTRIVPNMKRADGIVPPGDRLHMHHAVALNLSRRDATAPNLPERFYAFGEEKTTAALPPGYGYPLKGTDVLALNYMIHNLVTQPEVVYITYDLDWVPANSPTGLAMKAARPIWLDVENGKAYPVFDVKRHSGGADGRFTYPNDAPRDPYDGGPRRNEWTVDRDGVLLATAGHVHPGGLWTDLDVVRGASTRNVFRSEARYFDPNGPVSWDMAMTFTPSSWRVGVKRGDRLRISAAYETARASWYESMGIMILYMADGSGPNPFTSPVQTRGLPTHGHLPENNNHGGRPVGGLDPAKLPDGRTIDDWVGIGAFRYFPGGFSQPRGLRYPPTVPAGQSLMFGNMDAPASIFHSVTACKQPCTATTGLSYPLANGEVDFDSGQLGYGPGGFSAAANRATWPTPPDLDAGTYTYFCRVHPFMRGAFRVKGKRRGAGCRARVSISRRKLRLRGRRIAVRVRCAAGGGRCNGRLSLRTARRVRLPARKGRGSRRVRLRLGSRRFNIAAGRSKLVRVRVPARGRRVVRRRGKLRLSARAAPRRGACSFAVVRVRPTVRAPKRGARR